MYTLGIVYLHTRLSRCTAVLLYYFFSVHISYTTENDIRGSTLAPSQQNGNDRAHPLCRQTLGCPWHCLDDRVPHLCYFKLLGLHVGEIVRTAMTANVDRSKEPTASQPPVNQAEATPPRLVDYDAVSNDERARRSASGVQDSTTTTAYYRPAFPTDHEAWVETVLRLPAPPTTSRSSRRRHRRRRIRRDLQRQFSDVLEVGLPWETRPERPLNHHRFLVQPHVRPAGASDVAEDEDELYNFD